MMGTAISISMGFMDKDKGRMRRDVPRLLGVFGISMAVHAAVFWGLSRGVHFSGTGPVLAGGGNSGALVVKLLERETPKAMPAQSSTEASVGDRTPAKITRFFPRSELDKSPRVDFAAFADEVGQLSDEDVVFRLWIDDSGRVRRIEPVTAELSQTFIAAVRGRYMNASLSAAQRKGQSVASVVDVVLRRADPGGAA